jgi:predicted flap endonuclease-1-like 5' DNA nuclease/cytoskeletal protein CcmA (bactofilin family)
MAPLAMAVESPVMKTGPAQSATFYDDVTIRSGENFGGDVVVYTGDVTVEAGANIGGNLISFGGDVEIERGANIGGDVTAYAGSIEIGGSVGGSVSATAGDIELRNTASVGGNVSTLSGEVQREEGASVGGSMLRGPAFSVPVVPPGIQLPDNWNPTQPPPSGNVGGFVGRFFLWLGLAALAAVIGWFALRWQPEWIATARYNLSERLPLAVMAGLLVNVVVGGFALLFMVLFCFAPLGYILFILLLLLNGAGLAAQGGLIEPRLAELVRRPLSTTQSMLLGIGAPALAVALIQILLSGFCLGAPAFLLSALILAPGAGALLLRWLPASSLSGFPGTVVTPPAGSAAPPVAGADDVAGPAMDRQSGQSVEPVAVVAAAVRPVADATKPLADSRPAEQPAPSAAHTPGSDWLATRDVESDLAAAPASEAPVYDEAARSSVQAWLAEPAPASPVGGFVGSGGPGTDEAPDLPVAIAAAASPVEHALPQAPIGLQAFHADRDDNFTAIKDIGPAFNRRLKEAGIRTFAQLAATSPEQISAIVGWPVERVVAKQWREQAAVLAETGNP